jgi:nitrogen-specific signal transduction histidine kinase
MTILYIADSDENLKLVQSSLSKEQISITLRNFENLDGYYQLIDKHEVVLFDFSTPADFDLPRLQEILNDINQNNKPSIALFQKKDTELRNRLIQSGLTDYLTIPFDKYDLKIRLKNLINYNQLKKENLLAAHLSENESDSTKEIEQIMSLIKNSDSELPLSEIIKKSLKSLQDFYKIKTLLYFEIANGEEIILTESVPPYSPNEAIKIKINNLPIVAKMRKNERFVHTAIQSPQDENYTYIKSFLNIDFESIGVFPIWVNKGIKYFVILLSDKSKFFGESNLYFLKTVIGLIELSYKLAEGTHQTAVKKDHDISYPEFSKFLDLVINQLNFGILVIDNLLQIKYINKSAANLLQIDLHTSHNSKLDKIIGKSNTKKIMESRKKTEGTFERPEIEITSLKGDKILIGFTTTEFQTAVMENDSFILSLKDITYSKELQEEMSRMDRLASLGVMASGIAHEIRNPLAGIKAIAQTFEEELKENDPKNEYVKRIIKQVNRLDDMLKTLFSYAKPQKPNRQFYHIEEILQEVLSLLKQKLYKHNIKLRQSYASNLPPLYIDNSQIQQVLFNLILNSLEAIDKEGEIGISIEPVLKETETFKRKPFYKKITDNPFLQINITDTGCGIPQENMQQIFNPFFTTKNFGTGLGLSIVYQIVQENNGIIYFESEENNGTECFLFLPTFKDEDAEPKENMS